MVPAELAKIGSLRIVTPPDWQNIGPCRFGTLQDYKNLTLPEKAKNRTSPKWNSFGLAKYDPSGLAKQQTPLNWDASGLAKDDPSGLAKTGPL